MTPLRYDKAKTPINTACIFIIEIVIEHLRFGLFCHLIVVTEEINVFRFEFTDIFIIDDKKNKKKRGFVDTNPKIIECSGSSPSRMEKLARTSQSGFQHVFPDF